MNKLNPGPRTPSARTSTFSNYGDDITDDILQSAVSGARRPTDSNSKSTAHAYAEGLGQLLGFGLG